MIDHNKEPHASSYAADDAHSEMSRNVFEPPEGLLFSAVRRNWAMVLVVAILLAAAGAGLGLLRKNTGSTYTAAATLQVGQVNPNSPGFYSYVQSSAALATAFSRAIAAEPVLEAVQRKLGLTPSQSSLRLSAAPIPQAPAFRVIAAGPTATAAVSLANVSAEAVIAYVSKSNSANPEASSLLREYRESALALRNAVARVKFLGAAKNPRVSVLAAAESEVSAAAVKLKAIGVAYTATISSQAPRSGLVTLLAGATSASSDRTSKVELFAFIGLIVGMFIGSGLAVLRERRRLRITVSQENTHD
jgi:capsular polysaccharide biosynthesis protein